MGKKYDPFRTSSHSMARIALERVPEQELCPNKELVLPDGRTIRTGPDPYYHYWRYGSRIYFGVAADWFYKNGTCGGTIVVPTSAFSPPKPEVPEHKLVPMAVYGTLRPSQFNHDRFPDACQKVTRGCEMSGLLYDGGLPYLDTHGDGTVQVDILWMDSSTEDYNSICRMEMGARYTPVVVPVTVKETGEIVQCLVWHYDISQSYRDPRLVESGDWLNR